MKAFVQKMAMNKFVRAIGAGATASVAFAQHSFAAVTPVTPIDYSGAAPGISPADILTSATGFLGNYWGYVLMILGLMFAKPILNFIFFVIGKGTKSKA
jgi:hypothetical protein